jgi:hypothetical protein
MWMWPALLEALNDVLIRWACFLVGIPVQRSLHIRTHVIFPPHLIFLCLYIYLGNPFSQWTGPWQLIVHAQAN